jgi:hypothetical protein
MLSCITFRARLAALGLAAALTTPAAGLAADVAVGGKGPRVRLPDGRFISNHGRPIFLVDDDFADFGDLQTETAPPLRIEVKGDVEIIPLEDGGVRIRFLED